MRKLLDLLFTWPPFFYLLLAVNFFGSLYGFWWYRHQFMETNFLFWPFVPNSPLAVLYFFIALLFFQRGKRSVFWEGLAYFGLIKHGLWTVAIISTYYLAGRTHPENILLWAGHLAMALQAVLFWLYYGLPLTYPLAAAIAVWYLFDDFLDYVVGIHPYVDTSAISLGAVGGIALTYSVILTGAYLYTAWRHMKS
ncbi:MAG: DUF1405 domain-containing protein [Dethiobacter sp.]|jgi:uncharacterized membrane protein YpjA|nr:DUF1405 domain-containing protein [Dethiobacter sp.]MBS3990031.1 DUF1405 domain-containing protein [Dethiobacter sp.]